MGYRAEFFLAGFQDCLDQRSGEPLTEDQIDEIFGVYFSGMGFSGSEQREALSVLNRYVLLMPEDMEDSTRNLNHVSSLLMLIADFVATSHFYSRHHDRTNFAGLVDFHLSIKNLADNCNKLFSPVLDTVLNKEDSSND